MTGFEDVENGMYQADFSKASSSLPQYPCRQAGVRVGVGAPQEWCVLGWMFGLRCDGHWVISDWRLVPCGIPKGLPKGLSHAMSLICDVRR